MTSNSDSRNPDVERSRIGPLRPPTPIIDLHCDLLDYLATVKGADPSNSKEIGCAIPFLQDGKVKLQILAIYSGGGSASTSFTKAQCDWFRSLTNNKMHSFHRLTNARDIRESLGTPGTGITAAIESASALCDDNEPMDAAFVRLEHIIGEVGRIAYISLTHHGENRFGGGNSTDIGLKGDGEVLLDYIAGRGIAVDLSHTSDALGYGIINHIDGHGLDLPIIASHSNFRSVFDHKRNLPDELAQAVISRRGLIGMNFLRAFLQPDDPGSLARHLLYGLELGAQDALCFGADFFHTESHPDQSRVPFFFKEHEHAGKYQQILQSLESVLGPSQVEALAFRNAADFLQRQWPKNSNSTKQARTQ